MNRAKMAFGFCAAVALSIGACGKSDDAAKAAATPTHESIRMKSVPLMKSVAGILQSVKDEASAKAAAAQLADIGKQVGALKAEDDKLPKLSADEETALEMKMQAQTGISDEDGRKEIERIKALGSSVSDPVIAALQAIGDQLK